MPWFSKPAYQPKGKHCYVTGGSSGLGKALCESLVKQGAHVTIVARDTKKGEQVVQELKAIASPNQIITFISADLVDPTSSADALTEATSLHNGQAPDYVFCCAGFSKPKFFIDSTPQEMKEGFDGVFWVSAYTVYAAIQQIVKQRRTGKIILVSSFCGYASFAGYSTYSPGKYALRGLADALRSEMILHNIDIHIFMPAGILSPGYEVENLTKPAITHKIEEADSPLAPEVSAKYLETGLRKGYYQITDNIATDLVRMRSNAGVPSNNLFMDSLYLFVSSFAVPIWRMMTDWEVRKAKKDVQKDLETVGFYSSSS
ncbi:hypothetical protein CI109_103843 [Kwoniella shandongensis]|uniref:3-dehydrosphinganine reductase n=1 Tax=Kwoniella shandongensis TaxID=1734106 RepID=A0A5M6C7M1_9TREE|nr:uncharacterized protein CI109_000461 [Kwoniella shandongensis]KAA5530891.1 hypothetical protein CI109_000461 [Kwoniella shandongensis]